MKDIYRKLFNKDVYSDECCRFPSSSYSDEYVHWLEQQAKITTENHCTEPVTICPCCGSDKTYKTNAVHCSRCAVTTEI